MHRLSPTYSSSSSLSPSTSTSSSSYKDESSTSLPKNPPLVPRKRFPCEHCRHRKRKCDLIEPSCTRCQRLKRRCKYFSVFPPADLEYEARISALDGEVGITKEEHDDLERKLSCMEA